MMCVKPIKVTSKFYNYRKLKDYTARGAGIYAVPCGQCLNCRINQERIWTTRILLEQTCHGSSCFVSLTYDDKNLPNPPDLQKKHLQDYIKRLRYYVEPIKIRYFAVGEYGNPLSGKRAFNPHYHMALFGLGEINHRVIKETWEMSEDEQYGVTVQELNDQSARYMTGYIVKKTQRKKKLHPTDFGRKDEFMLSSRKNGGIGMPAIKKIAEQLNNNEFWENRPISQIKAGNKMLPLGRYLSRNLSEQLGIGNTELLDYAWINQEIHFARNNSLHKPEKFEIRQRRTL